MVNRRLVFQNSYAASTNVEDMMVSDFFVPGTRCWDKELIDEVFPEDDAKQILKTSPSPSGVPDGTIWHFSTNGMYSVKTAYHLAVRRNLESMGFRDLCGSIYGR